MKNIFISSTCYDLIDLRSELKEFLLSKGMNPIMSDELDTKFETPHDSNSIETCLVNLRQSDLVILILSQRYGPSLEKAGFEDKSATHLEYMEAVKFKKPVILFVRDRLDADSNIFKKNGGAIEKLSWISRKDIKLFDIMDEHKKLSNSEKNNWYWTFKNSVEIKKRLEIDLRSDFKALRLQTLIDSGNTPFLVVTIEKYNYPSGGYNDMIQLYVSIENFGSKPAIEPLLRVLKGSSSIELMQSDWHENLNMVTSLNVKSLGPGEKISKQNLMFRIPVQKGDLFTDMSLFELSYKTVLGDTLADISECMIVLNKQENVVNIINCEFKGKAYKSGNTFRLYS